MGSRAILIVCKSQDVARDRFGILEDEDGICYTRTGRRFFEDMSLERELLKCVRERLDQSGFWERLNTDWVCLDCELMPWSAKALEHVWHMDTIASFVDSDDGLLMKTPYQVVDLANPVSEAAATEWWTTLTEAGG